MHLSVLLKVSGPLMKISGDQLHADPFFPVLCPTKSSCLSNPAIRPLSSQHSEIAMLCLGSTSLCMLQTVLQLFILGVTIL